MTLEAPTTKPLHSTPNTLALVPDPPAPAPRAAPADATYGWEMFMAFTAAVLAITITVCVLTLVGSWWMLGVAVAAQFGVTGTMMRLIFGAFGSDEHAYPDKRRAEAVSRAAIFGPAAAAAPARPGLAAEH